MGFSAPSAEYQMRPCCRNHPSDRRLVRGWLDSTISGPSESLLERAQRRAQHDNASPTWKRSGRLEPGAPRVCLFRPWCQREGR